MSRVTDPIADYLTRIRNALHARHPQVDIPSSRIKREITRILHEEGFIRNYLNIDDGSQGVIRIYLKYDRGGRSVITGLKRVSSPGLRQYVGFREVPRVRNNLGVSVLTTPRGLMTGRHARREKVGGELLLQIW